MAQRLYTEEQVIKAIKADNWTHSVNEILERLTPIELPSDEEIAKEASVKHYGTNFKHVFASGATWMKEQILGKEDKTFKQKSKWTEVDNMTRRLK